MITQGKWFNNGGRIYAQQGDDIREICDVGLVNHQSKEDTGNARLITAAPDLLEACMKLVEIAPKLWGDDPDKHPKIMDKIEAAIAAAV